MFGIDPEVFLVLVQELLRWIQYTPDLVKLRDNLDGLGFLAAELTNGHDISEWSQIAPAHQMAVSTFIHSTSSKFEIPLAEPTSIGLTKFELEMLSEHFFGALLSDSAGYTSFVLQAARTVRLRQTASILTWPFQPCGMASPFSETSLQMYQTYMLALNRTLKRTGNVSHAREFVQSTNVGGHKIHP